MSKDPNHYKIVDRHMSDYSKDSDDWHASDGEPPMRDQEISFNPNSRKIRK